MRGFIESIKKYPAKGEAGKELATARLIENAGLEGDFHATGGERQISLRFTGSGGSEEAVAEKGLCSSKFRENITICGIDPNAIRQGERFTVGETLLEITGEIKHCHEECKLFQAGKSCPLAGLSLFAKVLKGGIIHVGDRV